MNLNNNVFLENHYFLKKALEKDGKLFKIAKKHFNDPEMFWIAIQKEPSVVSFAGKKLQKNYFRLYIDKEGKKHTQTFKDIVKYCVVKKPDIIEKSSISKFFDNDDVDFLIKFVLTTSPDSYHYLPLKLQSNIKIVLFALPRVISSDSVYLSLDGSLKNNLLVANMALLFSNNYQNFYDNYLASSLKNNKIILNSLKYKKFKYAPESKVAIVNGFDLTSKDSITKYVKSGKIPLFTNSYFDNNIANDFNYISSLVKINPECIKLLGRNPVDIKGKAVAIKELKKLYLSATLNHKSLYSYIPSSYLILRPYVIKLLVNNPGIINLIEHNLASDFSAIIRDMQFNDSLLSIGLDRGKKSLKLVNRKKYTDMLFKYDGDMERKVVDMVLSDRTNYIPYNNLTIKNKRKIVESNPNPNKKFKKIYNIE